MTKLVIFLIKNFLNPPYQLKGMLKRQLYIEQRAENVKLIVDLVHLTREKESVGIHRSHHSRIREEITSEIHQEIVTKLT
jgi:hypothetical protein